MHRDLKPGNVILSDEGHATLLDVGLARTNEGLLTRPGIALGSPRYMSPEQVVGGPLDGRSDLFTLSLVTCELLTGRRPYPEVPTQLMLLQHVHEPAIPVNEVEPSLPAEVAKVLLTALSKRPSERQPSVKAFVDAFTLAVQRASSVTNRTHLELPAALAQAKAKAAVDVFAEVVGGETEHGIDDELAKTINQRLKRQGGLATTLDERRPGEVERTATSDGQAKNLNQRASAPPVEPVVTPVDGRPAAGEVGRATLELSRTLDQPNPLPKTELVPAWEDEKTVNLDQAPQRPAPGFGDDKTVTTPGSSSVREGPVPASEPKDLEPAPTLPEKTKPEKTKPVRRPLFDVWLVSALVVFALAIGLAIWAFWG